MSISKGTKIITLYKLCAVRGEVVQYHESHICSTRGGFAVRDNQGCAELGEGV